MCLFVPSASNAAKLLHLLVCKKTAVFGKFCDTLWSWIECCAMVPICWWNTQIQHVLFINKAQFDLGGSLNSQNNILVCRKSYIDWLCFITWCQVCCKGSYDYWDHFFSLRQYVHLITLHSENMSNYESTLSKPHEQLTPKISVCILYRVVLVATNKQWTFMWPYIMINSYNKTN
jgi:hypothetical protein